MVGYGIYGQSDWCAAIWAGVMAGIAATLVEVLLWLILTDDFPAMLFRDARLTAALVLGRSVLPSSATFDALVMLVATLLHFMLSIAYAAVCAPLAARLEIRPALAAGAGFGIGLYVVNLYGFTAVFPWFAAARGGIALSAHGVFGMTAVAVYRSVSRARRRSGGH